MKLFLNAIKYKTFWFGLLNNFVCVFMLYLKNIKFCHKISESGLVETMCCHNPSQTVTMVGMWLITYGKS